MDEDSSSKAFPGGKLLLYVQNRAARFARAANGAPLTKSTSSSWSQNHIDFEPLRKAWTRGRISGEMYRSLLLNRFLPLTELDHFEVSPLTSLVKVTCTSDCYCTPAQILRDVLPTTKKCVCVCYVNYVLRDFGSRAWQSLQDAAADATAAVNPQKWPHASIQQREHP